MKTAQMPQPAQAELHDLRPFIDGLHKSLARVVRQLDKKAKAGGKAPELDDIKRMMAQIESVQSRLGMVAMIVGDEYVAKAIESVVPKLPALIARKRKELTDAKIEQLLEAVMPADPLKDVMLEIENDNVQLRQRFVKEHACLDSKTVSRRAGYSSANQAQTAWRWKNKRRIFSIDYFGKELFPALQFEDGKPLPIIKKILEIFATELSPWQIAFWFVAANSWLDGERPVDLFKQREDEVLEAAKREIERAYH